MQSWQRPLNPREHGDDLALTQASGENSRRRCHYCLNLARRGFQRTYCFVLIGIQPNPHVNNFSIQFRRLRDLNHLLNNGSLTVCHPTAVHSTFFPNILLYYYLPMTGRKSRILDCFKESNMWDFVRFVLG